MNKIYMQLLFVLVITPLTVSFVIVVIYAKLI